MSGFSLDYNAIHEYQQNSYPYLMIDYVDEVIPGKRARGFKNLTANDWFFKCHFPGDPSMPGMLQIEALVQMFALTVLTLDGNKGKVAYLTSANNLKFAKKVKPGDKFEIETELTSWKRGVGKGTGCGYVNGLLASKADFIITLPHILEQFLKKRND